MTVIIIHSFHKYLLRLYYIPSTVVGAKTTKMNNICACSQAVSQANGRDRQLKDDNSCFMPSCRQFELSNKNKQFMKSIYLDIHLEYHFDTA